jgi:hypothetical protein
MKRLPDKIEDVVTAISSEARPVYYLFGNWVELCNELISKGQSKTTELQRYPLVLLHNDYSETIDEITNKVTVDNAKIYLICQSEPNYSTQQRWESIYKLVLEPIYEDYIERMKFGSAFHKVLNKLEHERKDLYRLYVGDKTNRLPDHLDAIELTFKDLVYNLKKC